MAESVQTGTSLLLPATELAQTLTLRRSPNGVRYTSFGETKLADLDLDRIVEAVPAAIVPALAGRGFYFVPLALAEAPDGTELSAADTLVSTVYSPELSEDAICHRNVTLSASPQEPAHEGTFISARLLNDNFSLAFEFFINVGHAFAAEAGIPEAFTSLAWSQALAGVKGETSQDAWEARNDALAGFQIVTAETPIRRGPASKRNSLRAVTLKEATLKEAVPVEAPASDHAFDEKARTDFFESAFADALAIYQLSLAVDFDYSELREREYPLLAPAALADRLRLMAELFPPNKDYEFAIRYRRRA